MEIEKIHIEKKKCERKVSMKAAVEKIMLVLSGVLWGAISFWWIIISLCLAFPFSYPGSYDYNLQNQYLTPFGYFGLVSYVLIIVIAIMLNRKNPKRIAYFGITAVVTLIAIGASRVL